MGLCEDYSTTCGLSVGYGGIGSTKNGYINDFAINGELYLLSGSIDFLSKSYEADKEKSVRKYFGVSLVGMGDIQAGFGEGESIRAKANVGISPFGKNIFNNFYLGYPSTENSNLRNFTTFVISPIVEYNFKYNDFMSGISINVVIL